MPQAFNISATRQLSLRIFLSPPKWTKWTLEEIRLGVLSDCVSTCPSVYTMTHHLHMSYTTGRNGGAALVWKLLHSTVVMF